MKNDFSLPEIRDLTAVPSDELNKRTLAAMEQTELRKTKKKIPLVRRIAVCAALFCAALVLMGAGVRIFEYLTFVPGMGIVTVTEPKEPEKEIFTLARVVETETYRIEAVSMIPTEDEAHAGMWEVTVLTNKPVPLNFSENPDCMPLMTLCGKDGIPYTLSCDGDNGIGAKYTGYAVLVPDEESTEYTLHWKEETCTLSMISTKDIVWANYNYPVSNGLTVIAFPLAERSEYLVFDVIFEPQSENMKFWATHCENIYYTTNEVNITDTNGNTYQVYGVSGHNVTIPKSEREYGVNSLISYKMEYILAMNAPLESEIATIDFDEIFVIFNLIQDTGSYLVEIPELGEVVTAENLPNGGVFFDQYGIRLAFDKMTTRIDEQNNQYLVCFSQEGDTEINFDENVVYTKIGIGYIEPERAENASPMDFWGGGRQSSRNSKNDPWTFEYTLRIIGPGDRRNKGLDLTFGDMLYMRLNSLSLHIAGDWHIDFTAD